MAIITVDFDHTLQFEDGISINQITINQLKKDHSMDRLIIVTARRWSIQSAQQIHKFGKRYEFYWENVIHTDLRPKGPICKLYGSTLHFDDCLTELKSCEDEGIPTVNCFRNDVWQAMYPDPTKD